MSQHGAFKRGFKDFDDGRMKPPETYYSMEYIMEWHAGYAAAKKAAEEEARVRAIEERCRAYMTPAQRALQELEGLIGEAGAEAVRKYVAAVIEESKDSA